MKSAHLAGNLGKLSEITNHRQIDAHIVCFWDICDPVFNCNDLEPLGKHDVRCIVVLRYLSLYEDEKNLPLAGRQVFRYISMFGSPLSSVD